MKAVQTHFSREHELRATLFRELLHLQIQLQDYRDQTNQCYEAVADVIESIDRLLEVNFDAFDIKTIERF